MHGYLRIPYYFHKITATGAFGNKRARYIQEPIQTDGNAIKKALIAHHVKQYHESSCSVASVVSVVNAIQSEKNKGHEPLSQMDILEKVRTGNWKERMSAKGHNGRRGLPLFLLGKVVESSLKAFAIDYKNIETVQARKNVAASKKIKEVLRDRLLDFEKQGNCLIIAHFDQGAYVQALNIPHISPVGGFDSKKGRVTILDVDPLQEKPYKITFDTFYKGLASNYNHVFKPFGYDSGGYVYVKLRD
jgi:hypothetical protein